MKAYINYISYYLPHDVLTNDDINKEFPEWSIDKISNKTGITKRHIASSNEYTSDMAINVSEKLFKEYEIDRNNIDFIILCTQSPDYFLPTTACIVQDKLGLKTSTGALDFNLGCSGYVYGLALAKGLILGGIAKKILFITSETYSKFINPKDKSNRTIFGDAATASLISADKIGPEILEFDLGTDGSGAENLIVKNGAIRNPVTENNSIDVVDEYGNTLNNANLFMNGTEIFNFTSSSVPKLVNNVLTKNNLQIDDIDLFVFHQANKYMLNHLRKKINIDESKFYYYLENCGNTVSSTIPIALYESIKDKSANGKVLLAGFGVGYSWGACILNF